MNVHRLNRCCRKCGTRIIDKNKTGLCNKHRDRSGKLNPFYGKRHKRESVETARKKLRTISRKLWRTAEYRKKVISGVSKPRRETFKKEQSDRISAWYKAHPEQRSLRSVSMKVTWASGKMLKQSVKYGNKSKVQDKFFKELKLIYPGVTDTHVINVQGGLRRLPDSVDLRDRIVIEFYGDYWHANPEIYSADQIVRHGLTAKQIWERDRKRVLEVSQAGFDVIVVWERDYKRCKELVFKRIDGYVNWESCAL